MPVLLLSMLVSLGGFGQDVSHYKKIAESTNSKAIKLAALDSILSKTFNLDNKTFIDYSIQYIELAKEMDSIEAAAKKAMNIQYPLTNYANDPVKAIVIINGVLARKYKIKNNFLLGGLYLKRGGANFRINLKDAIHDYSLALEYFTEKDSVHIADTYLFRGQAYSNLGKFIQSAEDFKKAHDYFENLEDYEYMLFAQQGIINIYSMNGFYEEAKKERDALIQKMKDLGLEAYLSNEFYNQALDYKKTGKTDLEYKSLLLAEKHFGEDDLDKAIFISINSRLVEYYCEANDLIEAQKHLKKIEDKKDHISEDILASLNYFGAKATFLKSSGDYENALLYAIQKLEKAKLLGHEDEIINSHLLLSDIYFKSGDYRNSVIQANIHTKLKDSLYNRSNANFLAYYQTLYETEKKERQLVEKNSNITLLENESQDFKKVMIFIGIAFLLVFGLILLYRNQRQLKTNKILHERYGQELLASQEEERKRISKDLHDGLGQQLLLIKNKLIASGDEVTKKMVDATIDEVRSISRDLHPFQLQELGITKAIEYTINLIDENTTLFISAEIDNIDNIFSPEEEVNIYRIVQESLSNILKHAKAEAGKVSVKKIANNILISIKDNGVGFDFSEKYQDRKSLGLKTLLERTKFLKGQMKVSSKKDAGTVLEFQFPV